MSASKTGKGLATLALLAVLGCGRAESPGDGVGAVSQGLQSGPDFVITSVTGPASARPGYFIPAQVTVCNQGNSGDSAHVMVLLSADTTLQVPGASPAPGDDAIVGGNSAPYLSPGQCIPMYVGGYAPPPSSSPSPEGIFYLGAVVDSSNARAETDETNNSKLGGRIGVGLKPDFVVTSVTGPASAFPGQPITAEVTVCNQGTEGNSTSLVVLLSEDATLQAPGASPAPGDDRVLGASIQLPWLDREQCFTQYVNGPVPSPSSGSEGVFYLGAVVDPDNTRSEFFEDNNGGLGNRIGVGYRADFVVTAVTAGTPNVKPGQGLTAQVTVCNQGTQYGSTDVVALLSADANAQFPGSSPAPSDDQVLGWGFVSSLAPGRCATVPVSGNAYPPSTGPSSGGAVYLGAVVDPGGYSAELIEDNNSKVGDRVGVGHGVDYVVTAVKTPVPSVKPGQSLTVQVTVCNQGTQADSGGTGVVVLLSADAVIQLPGYTPATSEDNVLNGTSVPPLAVGQCVTVPVSGNVSTPFEAVHLGAVVDPGNYNPELLEDNNSKAGDRLGVGNRADFVVTSVTTPVPSVKVGQGLTAQVTVCNQGTQADSGGTEVALLLSEDVTLQLNVDKVLGSAPVPALAAGQCVTVPVSGNAYPPYTTTGPEGAFYLGAVVDPNRTRYELIEDNNGKVGERIGVGDRADFVVTSVTTPVPHVKPGQGLTAQVTVCNQGTRADSSEVALLLSADATVQMPGSSSTSGDDRVQGSAPVSTLNPGQCATVTVSGSAAPPTPSTGSEGPFYLGAVVDPGNTRYELLEDNNSRTGARMGVGYRADYVVTAVTAAVPSVKYGQPLTARVTVCNQGTQSDSGADVVVLLSEDTTLQVPGSSSTSSDDRVLTATSLPSLAAGQCTTVTVGGMARPSYPDGAFYLGAVVDSGNVRPEFFEDNNSRAGDRVGVGTRADFVVTSVTTAVPSVKPGQPLTAQVTVCNQGTQADATDVALLLSVDATVQLPGASPVPSDDKILGTTSVPLVDAGQCTTVSVSGNAYTTTSAEGAFYVGALVDPGNTRLEFFEDNNGKTGGRIGVGSRADYVVTAVTAAAPSVKPGQGLGVLMTVCNHGTQAASNTEVALLLSADATVQMPGSSPVPGDDKVLGTFSVPSLAVGQCTSVSGGGTISPPDNGTGSSEGAFYVGAVVDPRNLRPELLEDNNSKTGSRIGVGYTADFEITALSAPSNIQGGGTFSATMSVCNQGQVADKMDVELYLSADTTLRLPSQGQPPEDFYVGRVNGLSLNARACISLSVTLSAQAPASATYYLAAVADPLNNRPEIIEDNNIKLTASPLTVRP